MTKRRFADTDELFSHLMGYVNVEKGQSTELRLDRMRSLCAALGDPQASWPSLHVAGSKGKGSVSTMMARILSAGGLKTGLYTSPHLLRWKERISLAGDEMPEDAILEASDEVLPLVDGKAAQDFPGDALPTYFELTTLIAFCAFRRVGCDAVSLETGLGGRLDSTNVSPSLASVITPLELEHTEWLGGTLSLIAAEKAGIVKPGRPCYLSAQEPEAREVVARACAERGSPLRETSALVSVSDVQVGLGGTAATLAFAPGSPLAARFPAGLRAATSLVGAVQADNMALAALAAAESFPAIGEREILAGLAGATLPARFEVLRADPAVVLDGAHTPRSASLTLATFESLFPGPKALLFACAADKRRDELARILAPRFDRITITAPGTFKKSEPEAVWRLFRELSPRARLIADTAGAVRAATAEASALGMPLLVAGSFYLCAEADPIIRGGGRGPPARGR